MREIEWAPSKETPPHVVVSENLSEEYGPWQLAKGGGWARGGIASRCLHLPGERDVAMSCRKTPLVE